MQYEVTIGIPVYRALDYIRETMESALSQTYPFIEFLVLDDYGEDGSMAIVKKLQLEHPRGKDIRIIRHDRNYGVGVARNRILSEARGRFIYFLDSDDIIEADTIERLVLAKDMYHAEVVYGSWERVDKVNHSPSLVFIYPFLEFHAPDTLAMYAFKNYSSFRISVCNCLMDLSFLRNEHLQFLDTIFWEDLAFTYELVTKVKCAVLLPNITYHYLCRPGSLSHYQDRDILCKDEIMKNVDVIETLKKGTKKLLNKQYLPYYSYNLGMNSFYLVRHILKHGKKIYPNINYREMQLMLLFPLDISAILKSRHKRLPNMFLWILGKLPINVSIYVIKLVSVVLMIRHSFFPT